MYENLFALLRDTYDALHLSLHRPDIPWNIEESMAAQTSPMSLGIFRFEKFNMVISTAFLIGSEEVVVTCDNYIESTWEETGTIISEMEELKIPLLDFQNEAYDVPLRKVMDYINSQGWTIIGVERFYHIIKDSFEKSVL